jgi:hypothetical protein
VRAGSFDVTRFTLPNQSVETQSRRKARAAVRSRAVFAFALTCHAAVRSVDADLYVTRTNHRLATQGNYRRESAHQLSNDVFRMSLLLLLRTNNYSLRTGMLFE